ncbi:MAG: hypothetical protein ACLR2E_19360 [Lachnospiraceae bacterium]
MIYMDESIAAEYICEKAELDVVLTYQNSNASAMVKNRCAVSISPNNAPFPLRHRRFR